MKNEVISENSLNALRKVAWVMNQEEGRETSLEQALERIMKFYRKAVPFD
jgi:hypothetical protein